MDGILANARARGISPRCIVIINPSNPTGAVINKEDLDALVGLAAEENLVIVADEVYQENIFPGFQFVSCKATMRRLQEEKAPTDPCYGALQLISLHSISKGMMGEGGQRGGYFEAVGFPPDMHDQIRKFITYMLQPASAGQILVDLMVRPPQPGDKSYQSYMAERDAVFRRLQHNATALDEAYASMPDVHCAPAQGAIYHFPRVELSPMALQAAKDEGEAPDVWYCKALLEATGICVVPGSGFGMGNGAGDGKIWYRISFLDDGQEWVDAMREFQDQFVRRFWDES
jgi:alanine transaminase